MIHKKKTMPDFTGRKYRFHYLTALNLLESLGVPLRNIYIRCVGVYENYRGEIRSQEPEAGAEISGDTRITLEVGCSSAVDYMPYQFFYGLRGLREGDHTWEENARSLLAPFEAAGIRYEAALSFHALRYEFGIIDVGYIPTFLRLFEYAAEEDSADIDGLLLMISILPSLHEWGGTQTALSKILRRKYNYNVYINENVKSKNYIPGYLRYKLGAKTGRLGNETLLGRSFEEFDSTYELVFEDVSPEAVPELRPGGEMRRRIDRFLSYCMPSDLDCRYRIKVNKKAIGRTTARYLGYSTFI
jgi:hypothetical protein